MSSTTATSQTLVAATLAAVLTFLGLLHLYWLFGGRWAKTTVIPELDGRPALKPSGLATIVVAVALFVAALVALSAGDLVPPPSKGALLAWATLAIGLVFVLRAIGEFRLVGFFKNVKGTPFARWDTWLYSPLCLALGAGFLWLGLRTPSRT